MSVDPATVIDLNADLGEHPDPAGWARDAEMLACITSASLACGGHAGDDATMRRVGQAAQAAGVCVGAHVGYADKENFGRLEIGLPVAQIRTLVAEQVRRLSAFVAPRYIKPHGALYHRVMAQRDAAEALLDGVEASSGPLPMLGLAGSRLFAAAAARGWTCVAEGFADRGYRATGEMIPRGEPGAVLTESQAVIAQALRLARSGTIRSLCLHGDTPGAVALAAQLREALHQGGVVLEPAC